MNRLITIASVMELFITILSLPQIAHSSPVPSESTRKVGIGIQSSPFPIFGPAVVYNLNKNIGLQGIGRIGIDVDFLAIRALVRFKTRPTYNIYANGLFGIFRDNDVQTDVFAPSETDQANGFGIGGGLEFFIRRSHRVGWNVEVDFIHIAFEKKWWKYDYEAPSLVMIGIGAHYYF